jgi:hypothetical protein
MSYRWCQVRGCATGFELGAPGTRSGGYMAGKMYLSFCAKHAHLADDSDYLYDVWAQRDRSFEEHPIDRARREVYS